MQAAQFFDSTRLKNITPMVLDILHIQPHWNFMSNLAMKI
ncbi:MAG: hypothetical protein ACJA2G_002350 [Cognaticolwellia sp.]|jgi:hypothetical protein